MIVGTLGMKRSGKDTTADYLVEKHGFKKMAFADTLKATVKTMYHLTDEQVNGDTEIKERVDERWGKSPRTIMQEFGTDIVRKTIDENFWINDTRLRIEEIMGKDKDSKIVIADLRFPNEAKMIKDRGGIILRITRPGIKREDTHASEILVDEIESDYNIINDGSLEDLYRKIEEVIRVCPSFV